MRQRYFAFLSLFACLPAMALTFESRIESAEWKVEGDQFECRLTQPIKGFGSGEFIRRAGEQPVFRLNSSSQLLAPGRATLLAAAAPWQPGRNDINLGSVSLGSGRILFTSSQAQASRLIAGLLDGRSTLVRAPSGGGRPNEVRVLPVRFAEGYDAYQACAAKLLPMNYDQVRQTQVGFPGAGMDLDADAKARLDVILAYIKADPAVNHVELDGHSDNSGNRLTNRELSRRRAMAVEEYLKAHGVPEEQIVVRFHGEQYPLVPNNSPANRARNRRVSIQLDKLPEAPKAEAPAPAPTATAPATSAPAAATPASKPAAPAPAAKS